MKKMIRNEPNKYIKQSIDRSQLWGEIISDYQCYRGIEVQERQRAQPLVIRHCAQAMQMPTNANLC